MGLKDNIPLGDTLPQFPVCFLCSRQCGDGRRGKGWGRRCEEELWPFVPCDCEHGVVSVL